MRRIYPKSGGGRHPGPTTAVVDADGDGPTRRRGGHGLPVRCLGGHGFCLGHHVGRAKVGFLDAEDESEEEERMKWELFDRRIRRRIFDAAGIEVRAAGEAAEPPA